jgi:hypothetical protein
MTFGCIARWFANSTDGADVDVPSLAAGSAAAAPLSSAPSADISGDRDLIRDNAPPSRELCTDQV